MATRKKTAPAHRAQTPLAETSAPKTAKTGLAGRSTRALHAATPTPVASRTPLIYSAPRASRTLDRTPARPAPEPEPIGEKNGERGASVRQRFGELRGLLADGWEIVQPIFARPLWSATDNSTTAFNFVLRRENATRLLTVPEGRTVQRFIRERNLLVDYRR
jgi:hypothetical protein